MNLNQFTIKAQEAIAKAQQLAFNHQNQQIETLHVLKALLDGEENAVEYLLKKNEVNTHLLIQKIDEHIQKLPKTSGEAAQHISRDLNNVILKAGSFLKEFGDEFVAQEHLLLGLLSASDTLSGLLKDAGLNEKNLKQSIKESRKGSTVNSQTAETQYDWLKKFAKN